MLPREDLNRLRWRCVRRGLLELDLMLGKFIDETLPSLTDEQVAAFVTLADLEDLELWGLINGSQECRDAKLAEVLAMLRKT